MSPHQINTMCCESMLTWLRDRQAIFSVRSSTTLPAWVFEYNGDAFTNEDLTAGLRRLVERHLTYHDRLRENYAP